MLSITINYLLIIIYIYIYYYSIIMVDSINYNDLNFSFCD